MENGRLAVEEVAGLGRGRLLDLACLPTLAVAPLAPMVGAFRAAYPDVSIVLSDPQDTAELVEFVRTGRSEVGLVERVVADDIVSVIPRDAGLLGASSPGTKVSKRYRLRQLATTCRSWPAPSAARRGPSLDDALRAVGANSQCGSRGGTALESFLLPR